MYLIICLIIILLYVLVVVENNAVNILDLYKLLIFQCANTLFIIILYISSNIFTS